MPLIELITVISSRLLAALSTVVFYLKISSRSRLFWTSV